MRVSLSCPWGVETVTGIHVTPGVNCCDSFEVEQMKKTVFLYLHQCLFVPAAEELNLESPGRGRRIELCFQGPSPSIPEQRTKGWA